MSLFRLFTREREKDTLRKETVAAALPPPPAPSVVPPNTAPAVAAPPSPSAPPPPLDLERIRRELQQIALILGADGPGDEAGAVSSEYTALSIPLGEIMRICPSAFKSPANLDAVRDTRLTVEVPSGEGGGPGQRVRP